MQNHSEHPAHVWLEGHGISRETAYHFGLSYTQHSISIPIFDKDGLTIFKKHRMFRGDAKYLYDKGSTACLYGIELLTDSVQTIYIVEGEADSLCLRSQGLTAVSTTGGAGTFKKEWADLFLNKKVIICYDRDEAGAQGMLRILRLIPHAQLLCIPPTPKVKDVSDFIVREGFDAFKKLIPFHFSIPTGFGSKGEQLEEYRDAFRTLSAIRNPDNALFTDEWMKILGSEYDSLRRPQWETVSHGPDGSHLSLEQVKQVPITRFATFDGKNKRRCIWHEENTPSMHYYPDRNRVHCYGACAKSGDVIDVVMALQNKTFKEAINIIKGV